MQKKAYILPPDPYDRNLLEIFIAQQQILIEDNRLMKQELQEIKAALCLQKMPKNKAEIEAFYTEAQVAEKLQLSRQTLSNYRKKGLITFTKKGNAIRYTQQDIDNYKLLKVS